MDDTKRLLWQADCDARARLAEQRIAALTAELGVALVFESGQSSSGGPFARIVCVNTRPEPVLAPSTDAITTRPALLP